MERKIKFNKLNQRTKPNLRTNIFAFCCFTDFIIYFCTRLLIQVGSRLAGKSYTKLGKGYKGNNVELNYCNIIRRLL